MWWMGPTTPWTLPVQVLVEEDIPTSSLTDDPEEEAASADVVDEPTFEEGAKVIALQGSFKFEAKVLETKYDGKTTSYLIHYKGYSKADNEWVVPGRLEEHTKESARGMKSFNAMKRRQKVLVGELVSVLWEAEDGEEMWYKGEIIEERTNEDSGVIEHLVEYEPDQSTEWIDFALETVQFKKIKPGSKSSSSDDDDEGAGGGRRSSRRKSKERQSRRAR